ncbi:hypothetical protein BCV69DRAFT_281768, partial [Microstroma glucosiphilum]
MVRTLPSNVQVADKTASCPSLPLYLALLPWPSLSLPSLLTPSSTSSSSQHPFLYLILSIPILPPPLLHLYTLSTIIILIHGHHNGYLSSPPIRPPLYPTSPSDRSRRLRR